MQAKIKPRSYQEKISATFSFLIKHSFHLTFFFFYTIDSESKRNIRNELVMKIQNHTLRQRRNL